MIYHLKNHCIFKPMLKSIFIELCTKYSSDEALVVVLWNNIENAYSEKGRHYHTLAHLEDLYSELNEVKSEIVDWDALLFTLFYHDVVYNAKRSDNETKSGEVAMQSMEKIGVPKATINLCVQQIIETQKHQRSANSDTNYFLDADLSVLGREQSIYQTYFENVRKEYKMYPDFLYRPGRKKVLQHFLEMESIFKTDYFRNKYEAKAKENLGYELSQL